MKEFFNKIIRLSDHKVAKFFFLLEGIAASLLSSYVTLVVMALSVMAFDSPHPDSSLAISAIAFNVIFLFTVFAKFFVTLCLMWKIFFRRALYIYIEKAFNVLFAYSFIAMIFYWSICLMWLP